MKITIKVGKGSDGIPSTVFGRLMDLVGVRGESGLLQRWDVTVDVAGVTGTLSVREDNEELADDNPHRSIPGV